MKYMHRKTETAEEDEDPLSGVANLFDAAMVFALGLMVMLLIHMSIPELLTQEDVVVVRNPGTPDMQVIVKHGEEIEMLNVTDEMVEVEISNVMGMIGETADGATVYVPEGG
ncbi:MAG: DUF2149 domain-containing protein [Euryarchaeota archaeon]|nr:DUF2149 domain-containing protein [Euryarchaeota archaeon]